MNSGQNDARHYLLDATCFYALSTDSEKRLALGRAASSMTTTILAVAELACVGDTADDFMRRKAAMRALTAVCPSVIAESPDDIVAGAFGRPNLYRLPFAPLDIDRVFELASSRDEAIRGVKDPMSGKRLRLNPAGCRAWKSEIADRYRKALMLGNRYASDFLRNDNPEAVAPATPDAIDVQAQDRFMSLFCVAIRSGLLAECEVKFRSSLVALAAEFVPLLSERYNGKLEPYISMDIAYRRSLAAGQEPETDAVFGLENFLYLDALDDSYTFVTAEDRWLEPGHGALPGRVKSLDEVTSS
ncbi:MAG TPA: hypothetical protein VMH22_02475 [bacterium]|nr:hypothetical protein [bacterium]